MRYIKNMENDAIYVWSELQAAQLTVDADRQAQLGEIEKTRYIEIYKLKSALKEAQAEGEQIAIDAINEKLTLLTGPGAIGVSR